MNVEAVPLDPTGHLLHKATLPIPGDIAALPNTQKQTQKHGPNEITEQNSRKKLNKMETNNLPETEFKSLVTRITGYLTPHVQELEEQQ